jgi:hypothetical protein
MNEGSNEIPNSMVEFIYRNDMFRFVVVEDY